jgi:DNA-binding NtrC family response regulator
MRKQWLPDGGVNRRIVLGRFREQTPRECYSRTHNNLGAFGMPFIPHLMVLDDDTRVLESLVPNLANEIKKQAARSELIRSLLASDSSAVDNLHLAVNITAHGFESERLKSFKPKSPFALRLHMVRETGGRFEQARRLLNQQLFAVVVSDLRFSDDAGGQRAGKLFIEELERVHPSTVGILYSAYPRPEGFAADRFVRKASEDPADPSLASVIVRRLEQFLRDPSTQAFAQTVTNSGLLYQSDSFGTTLAQIYNVARLLRPEAASPATTRVRRPLPCVLLDGESGTGKRGLASVFHAAGERRKHPQVVASCSDLTNETLLRSILFGHKRGAFTDAREERQGLVTATGKGVLLLDDFHRLPPACSAIVHSFLEDGEYSKLGEEEVRRNAECAVVLTVESGPWRERRRSGELPLAFLARVERLPIEVAPLRDRPEDIVVQACELIRALSHELGVDMTLSDEARDNLRVYPFAESNSRELRNAIEQAVYHHYRESDVLEWSHLGLRPFDSRGVSGVITPTALGASSTKAPSPLPNEWQKRLRDLAVKILARGLQLDTDSAGHQVEQLFEHSMPQAWSSIEAARTQAPDGPSIPMPVWEDLWRCFAVHWLGGPTPAEKILGIPANTLRQWINDREGK